MPDKWINLECTINFESVVKNQYYVQLFGFLDFLFENIEINTVEQDDNNNINNKHVSITIDKAITE